MWKVLTLGCKKRCYFLYSWQVSRAPLSVLQVLDLSLLSVLDISFLNLFVKG